jgi:hypothetical protein
VARRNFNLKCKCSKAVEKACHVVNLKSKSLKPFLRLNDTPVMNIQAEARLGCKNNEEEFKTSTSINGLNGL